MTRKLTAFACAVLGLFLAAGALAATSPVVPAGGKVAGRGYAYYFMRLQQLIAPSTRPIPTCSTVTVGGQKVAMMNLNPPRVPRPFTCSEPAGRAIYLAVFSITCSTQQGAQSGLTPPSLNFNVSSGTSDADLVKCARDPFPNKGLTLPSTALDGHPVNLHPLVTATRVFFVPKKLGGPARAAAYGVGVLLRGLSKGTHTIQIDVKGPPLGPPPPGIKITLKVHVA